MRKIREVLRLKWAKGMSNRKIATSSSIGRPTVRPAFYIIFNDIEFPSRNEVLYSGSGATNPSEGEVDIESFRLEESVSVPAPATLALFGLGLAGLGWSRRKKA